MWPEQAAPRKPLVPLTTQFIDDGPAASMFMPPKSYRYVVGKEGRDPADVIELSETFAADDPKFIVHNEVGRTYLVFDCYSDYKAWLLTVPTRTLHEVIRGCQAQKLKFDIDADADKLDSLPIPSRPARPDTYGISWVDDDALAEWRAALAQYERDSPRTRKSRWLYEQIMSAIVSCFEWVYGIRLSDTDFAVSDSTDATKFSRHIVISTYSVADAANARLFMSALLSRMPRQVSQFIDPDTNKSVQNFRLPGCHKAGSTRVKRCVQGGVDALIITLVSETERLPSAVIAQPDDHSSDTCSADDAVIVKAVLPLADGHEFHTRKGNMYLFRRVRAGHCSICGRTHDKDNTLYAIVRGGTVSAYCRHKKGSCSVVGLGS